MKSIILLVCLFFSFQAFGIWGGIVKSFVKSGSKSVVKSGSKRFAKKGAKRAVKNSYKPAVSNTPKSAKKYNSHYRSVYSGKTPTSQKSLNSQNNSFNNNGLNMRDVATVAGSRAIISYKNSNTNYSNGSKFDKSRNPASGSCDLIYNYFNKCFEKELNNRCYTNLARRIVYNKEKSWDKAFEEIGYICSLTVGIKMGYRNREKAQDCLEILGDNKNKQEELNMLNMVEKFVKKCV